MPEIFRDTPRLLSPEEKRELILAHAAARMPQDPMQRLSLWVGIATAVAVLATGWWLTVGWQIKQSLSRGGSEVRQMTERLNEFTEQVNASPLMQSALPSPTPRAAAAELGERIKSALQSQASSSGRQADLMAPRAPGATVSPAATSTPSLPVDPKTPGLTPDQ